MKWPMLNNSSWLQLKEADQFNLIHTSVVVISICKVAHHHGCDTKQKRGIENI